MGRLTNDRHETFAQGLAKGMSQTDAYVAAGYKSDRGAASRMSANVNVQARVEELQSRAASNVVISREWVIEQLVENAKLAKEQGDFAPANKAVELLGKELGMFVDRTENVNLNYDTSSEPLGEDEWSEQFARPN